MKNKKIEKSIKIEFEKEVPDVLDKVLLNCEEREEKNDMKNKIIIIKPILSFVYVFALVLIIGIISFRGYNATNRVDSIIEFDVNPSIEVKTNRKNKIIEAKALNGDGEKILKDMNLKGSDLNVGVNAIIGSMYKNGYINEFENSILVTVDNKDKVKGKKLQKEIANEINSVLNSYNIESAVITQQYESKNVVETKSTEHGISRGKAEFVEKIIENELTNKNGKKYTFDELAELNINELSVILESKDKKVDNVSLTGTSSTKNYIGKDKAKNIALTDCNVQEANARDIEIELDYEFGKMIYEISFESTGLEYEYEINATTGEIINKKIEKEDDYVRNKINSQNSTSQNKPNSVVEENTSQNKPNSVVEENTSQNKPNNTTEENTKNGEYITRAKAKSIALNDAGVNENNVRDLSIELDRERGTVIYEVDFEASKKEYEYDIDALTGKIINKKIEKDD